MQSFLRLVFSSAVPYSHSSLYRAGKTMLLRLLLRLRKSTAFYIRRQIRVSRIS